MSDYGMPYAGSKSSFIASLAMNFPKADHFYDLFGGGGAVTHYMIKRKDHNYKHFHYNELNVSVYDLFVRAIKGDFNNSKFKLNWISRDEFFKTKDKDALVRYIYSFSNNGSTYQFGPQIEPYKKSMHMAVVFGEFDSLAKEVFGFDKWPTNIKTIKAKRLYLRQLIEFYRVKNKLPKVLHQFLPSKQLEQLQQLERLHRLQRLEQLHGLNKLNFSSKDYRDVEILPNSVVYCDIPYLNAANTIKYIKDGFNHQEFYEWAASREFPVYISEYVMPHNFICVYQIEKRNLYSSFENKKNINEKLYWNGRSIN